MKKTAKDNLSLQQRLANFLLTYRTTPQATTNVTPCELLMGRALQTRFDMLRPSTEKRVCDAQAKQKLRHDEHGNDCSFTSGQTVWVRDFCGSTKWVPGVIVQSVSLLTYMIQLDDKSLWKRHVDHIQHKVTTEVPSNLAQIDSSQSMTQSFPLFHLHHQHQVLNSYHHQHSIVMPTHCHNFLFHIETLPGTDILLSGSRLRGVY